MQILLRDPLVDEYYVKNGRHGNKEVEYSQAYIDQKKSTAAWSDAWTRYNKHIRNSCSNLGRAPRTYIRRNVHNVNRRSMKP